MKKHDSAPLCFLAASLLAIATLVSGQMAYLPIALVFLILGIRQRRRREEALLADLSRRGIEIEKRSHIACDAASLTEAASFFAVLLSYGNTAQFVGSVGDAFSAICCLQIFRFTSSKPSKSAIASDEKFIRLRTSSFVRYCPRN